MQYSKVLAALPVALAAAAEVDYTTVVVQTVVQTVTAGAPAAPSDTPAAYSQPAQHAGHGHSQFHSSSAAVATPSSQAPSSAAQQASSAPASSASAAPSGGSGGSSASGGCPADTSGQHMSPGIGGKPQKSEIDSINYLRRLYNPNANCLSWSDSLASASQTCANDQSESHLRVNSGIVSAPGYCQGQYYTGDLASSEFERSMIWMLCQAPSDPELKGTCSGKTGEANCSGGACQGHHDLIVDKENQYHYMGCGSSSATSWLSCSFSAQDNAPSGY